jgi:hypothetical protein
MGVLTNAPNQLRSAVKVWVLPKQLSGTFNRHISERRLDRAGLLLIALVCVNWTRAAQSYTQRGITIPVDAHEGRTAGNPPSKMDMRMLMRFDWFDQT